MFALGPVIKCLMIFLISLQTSSDDDRISSKKIDNPKIELLFHETTKNFDRLPIQYRVSMQDFFSLRATFTWVSDESNVICSGFESLRHLDRLEE